MYEYGQAVLKKSDIENDYDILVSCNPVSAGSFWNPSEGSRLAKGSYGVGISNLIEGGIFITELRKHPDPQGKSHFVSAGKKYVDLRIQGNYAYSTRSSEFPDGLDLEKECSALGIKKPDLLVKVENAQDVSLAYDSENPPIRSHLVLLD